MKSYYLLAIGILALSGLFSCKKKNHTQPKPPDIDLCFHRDYYSHAVQGADITDSEMDTVKSLFESNHLSLDNLQVIGISYTKDYYEIIHVEMNQFVNNLLIFYGEAGFHFRKINGDYVIDTLGLERQIIHSSKIDSAYHVNPLHAANILYRQMINDFKITGWNANWKDSCYNVILGVYPVKGQFYDDNVVYGLVWKVSAGNNYWPYCIVDAISGKLLGYSDGIIVN